jgi:hypothetical protein
MLSFSRRQALYAGLGLFGLSLPRLLHAGSGAPRKKSVIYVVLNGGPSHIDMWDLKPDAPADYRGPFKPIATSLTGVQIGEHMPLLAARMKRVALLRGVRSVENDHFLSEVYSGLPRTAGKRPAFGCAVSRLAGTGTALPSYVSLDRPSTDQFEFEKPYYAGASHAPFRPFGDAVDNLKPVSSMEKLGERKELLRAFDTLRKELDNADALDRFSRQAMEIMTSPAVRDAFDLSREPARLRERYCGGKYTHQTAKDLLYDWDGRPFLLARRLVEAGVRVVTLQAGPWDHHSGGRSDIFYSLKLMLPALDRSLSALMDDLHNRGLSEDVLVVVLGEFGRTPKITYPGPGREHWADAGCVLFCGGGLTMGQVIGATDARAERAKEGKISFQNVISTIYHVLGVDPGTRLTDFGGRPQYLLEDREPVSGLDAPSV